MNAPANILKSILFIIIFLTSISVGEANSATISGIISDEKTKDPLIGATVKIVGASMGGKSGLNGSYRIKDVPEGKIKVSASYPGYQPFDTTLIVSSSDEIALNIYLTYRVVKAGELTVSAESEHGSDMEAQKTTKNADNVISSVSARTIEVSPDLSVANVSQRVSGVSMTRTSNGDAQYAIIRGMDKRYNYTTINGIKIPSPDNKNRYVPLDIFPSELLDRLEVTKSLVPSMEGDATGGAMNLVMKQAPDHEIASLQLGTGYNGIFTGGRDFSTFTPNTSESPRIANGVTYSATPSDFPSTSWSPKTVSFVPGEYFSGTYGNRFFDDQTLGVIVAGSFQNSYRGANTIFFAGNVDQVTSLPHLNEYQNRTYSTLQSRVGGMVNLDYRANDNNSFKLFGMYANLLKREVRDVQDTDNTHGGWPNNPDILHSIRFTNETQGIANITLSGINRIFGNDLEADWHLVYSNATLNSPDEAHLSLDHGLVKQPDGSYLQPRPEDVQDSKRLWTKSNDQDKSAYLNLKTILSVGDNPAELLYGGMYRSKTRSSIYDEYSLRVKNGTQYYTGDISKDTFTVYNKFGNAGDPLNYDAHENVIAGFVQAKVGIGNLLAIGGIRIEKTDFGWTSAEDPSLVGKTGTISYLDMLPSINLKYSATENQNWRLSYFKSLSRPSFYEVIPNGGIAGDDYTEISNVNLQPTRADNLDLRWEFFPGGLDQLLAGVFYKRLQNPIEWVVQYQQTNTVFGPLNLGTATNFGFELDVRKYFSNFGVSGNYTFTNSQITTKKVVYSNHLTDSVSQTRPLEGQSEHVANLSLLYKDFESGTNAQISAVYTGAAIVGVSVYKDDDVWQKGYVQLDFSGEQKIFGNFAVYVKVTNILNTAREEVIHQTYHDSQYPQHITNQTDGQDVLIRRELYDRNYILGIRLKM